MCNERNGIEGEGGLSLSDRRGEEGCCMDSLTGSRHDFLIQCRYFCICVFAWVVMFGL